MTTNSLPVSEKYNPSLLKKLKFLFIASLKDFSLFGRHEIGPDVTTYYGVDKYDSKSNELEDGGISITGTHCDTDGSFTAKIGGFYKSKTY